MEYSQFLDALRRDTSAFEADITTAGWTATVPSCPGWTASDLCWHLTEVLAFWGTVVAERRQDLHGLKRLQRPDDAQLLALFAQQASFVIGALASATPGEMIWTWTNDRTVGFAGRRMAHETAVHACDAALAAARVPAMDSTLASDGIDEFLEHFVHRALPDAEPIGGSVHVHCGDVPGEWTIQPPPTPGERYSVTREHAKGDCALRGEAANLLFALWRRTGPESIDIVGDTDVARRFLAATNLS